MTAPAPDPIQDLNRPIHWWWLQALAWLLVASTFILVGIGGKVTSLDAGLAVPHGWMTFDAFTPFAPLETWWHDVQTRWEHSHRLKGYVVGSLTLAVAAGLWLTAPNSGVRKGLAVTLVVLVIVQGVMGAMRVDTAQIESQGVGVAAVGTETPTSTAFRIAHGIVGQVFLCLTVIAAVLLGRLWLSTPGLRRPMDPVGRRMMWLAVGLWVVFLIQLALGAGMRHTYSALAIPDFPLHFGSILPPMSQASLDAVASTAGFEQGSIQLWQMYLHLAHRWFAWVVCVAAVWVIWRIFAAMDWPDVVLAPSITIISLLVVQIVLGITVVLSGKEPMVATIHQIVGAVLIASSAWLVMRVRLAAASREPDPRPAANVPGASEAQTTAQPTLVQGGVA